VSLSLLGAGRGGRLAPGRRCSHWEDPANKEKRGRAARRCAGEVAVTDH
jgi:hypothetical protein